jgi:hypothetical protein
MSSHDPNLEIRLLHDIAEIGGHFTCDVKRSPSDGETNDGSFGQVRAVRIRLVSYTEGRGDVDTAEHAVVEMPVDQYGMASGQIQLGVPVDAPVSYDGSIIRVRWYIEARTDIALKRDQKSSADVLVVPVGGHGRYEYPHPLPHA